MKKPMFQKRHYELIAYVIKNVSSMDDLVIALARAFAADNPNFNGETFIEACGDDVFVVTPEGEAELKRSSA